MAVLTGSRSAAATPLPDDVTVDLTAVQDRHKARVGMYAIDVNSAARLQYRPDDRFAMCSTFKTYAAARVLQLTDQGRLRLDTPIPIEASDIVENSPVTSAHVGDSITLEQICAAALEKSDNTAGNLLLRHIGGPQAIGTFARSVGDDQSRLDRWETELNTAFPGDPRDTTTPRALASGYREVLVGAALSHDQRARLLTWMRANATSQNRFRAGLPPGWTSADKTGAGDFGSTNDAGLLLGPAGQRIILVVLTRSRDDVPDTPPLNDAIAETVRLTVDRFSRQ